MLKLLAMVGVSLAVSGCSVQRAVVANQAQDKMVGLSREQVLACMGPPANRHTEGQTEVWSYGSGDGTTISRGQATVDRQFGRPVVSGLSVSRGRSCTVNVVMAGGRVSRVNYAGPTGGILTPGEQCAYAVQNCGQ